LFGGLIYNLDSFMDVIPMLVFTVCWDDVFLNNKLYKYMFTLVTGHLLTIISWILMGWLTMDYLSVILVWSNPPVYIHLPTSWLVTHQRTSHFSPCWQIIGILIISVRNTSVFWIPSRKTHRQKPNRQIVWQMLYSADKQNSISQKWTKVI